MTEPTPDRRPYDLAAAGLHIFPTSGDKRPLTRHGLTEATTDHEQIAEWVIEYGDRIQGWGVNCGASGLVVADIDVKNGKDGLQALKAAQLELPRTFTYQTPSGGQHHIYRHELAHTFKSRADIPHNGQPLQGVDVRAGGGYIIWHGHETPYPETLAILPTPPAWLTIPRDTDNHTRPGEKATHAALTEWLNSDHTRNPATVHTIEATLTRLEHNDFGHDELLRAQGAIARASGHGYQISGYEQRLRAAWLRAPWDTPERHREYTDGLAGAIAKYATDDTNEIDAARIIANIPTRHTETTQANNENTSTEDTTPTPTADDHTEQAIQTRLAQLLIDKEARQRLDTLKPAPTPPEWLNPEPHLNGTHQSPQPTIGTYTPAGTPLLYAAAVNGLIGDPEAAKTILATAIAVDELHAGGTVAWLDLDHNGPSATIARFRRFGATPELIRTACRFGFPEDQQDMQALIDDLTRNPPTLCVIDSIGELLPLYNASSNDADEYTRVHQQVMARTATAGAAVLTIDHLSKGTDSRNYGATGSIAKKRAYDGLLLRVTADGTFRRGHGGKSDLRILKDRHGALREQTGSNSTEAILARFVLTERENEATRWELKQPGADLGAALNDVETLDTFNPPPASVRDVIKRAGWHSERARLALKTWREEHGKEN